MNVRRYDHAGLEILDEIECLRLMATVPIGRLVFTEGGLPTVRPVNFTIDGETVVFCTADGDKHRAAERGDVVAFEADSIDADRQLGWTVTVAGVLSPLTDLETTEVALALPVHPWTPGRWPLFIRLTVGSVRGRRVRSMEQPGRTTRRRPGQAADPAPHPPRGAPPR